MATLLINIAPGTHLLSFSQGIAEQAVVYPYRCNDSVISTGYTTTWKNF